MEKLIAIDRFCKDWGISYGDYQKLEFFKYVKLRKHISGGGYYVSILKHFSRMKQWL